MPVTSKSVKINRKGKVFVMQGKEKKKQPGVKGQGQFIPYDIQKGIRIESERKSDIDEDENYNIARQLSR